ncbi:MAG: hypothetical protein LBS99_03005 [Clostridiales bacterium]|nr:hypothetical protein [Clostridiales bacterium]
MAKDDVKNNQFLVRVASENTLILLEEIMKNGYFSTKNAMLNRCLDVGAPLLLRQITGKDFNAVEQTSAVASPDIERKLKQLEINGEDLFVLLNVIEHMTATLYNAKLCELSGEPIAAEDLMSGRLSVLPDNLNAVKAELIKRYERRAR